MDSFEVAATDKTPWVILDKKSGLFRFMGNSFPDNVLVFYEPIIRWFEQYAADPNPDTVIRMKFTYINSSTRKMLVRIGKIFDRIHQSGKGIRILWEYESDEEDLREIGYEWAQQQLVPLILKEVKS